MAYTPLKIHIPEPCHEDWAGMAPVAGTTARHCDSCAKNVTDFTGFSDAQLHAYVRENKGKLCGRFRPDQLGRPMRAKQAPTFNPLKIAAAAAGLMAMGTGCTSPQDSQTLGEITPVEQHDDFNPPIADYNLPILTREPYWTGEYSLDEDVDSVISLSFDLPDVIVEEEHERPTPQPDIVIPENPFDDDMIMGLMTAPALPEPTGVDWAKDTLRQIISHS